MSLMVGNLPWPPRALWPNGRSHWSQRARLVKQFRKIAWALTREALQRTPIYIQEGPIKIGLVFHPPTVRQRDQDGMIAACKSLLDGVADALGVNDARFKLEPMDGAVEKGGQIVVVVY